MPKLAARCKGGKDGVSFTFKRIMEKAGVDAMTGPGSGFQSFSRRSFHSLRYSFNSTLANAGVSQEIRVKFTGHSSLKMNDHYTKLAFEPLKQAIAALPNFYEESPAQPTP
jgi:integrase